MFLYYRSTAYFKNSFKKVVDITTKRRRMYYIKTGSTK
ncbi:hypothetical protein [Salmonella phage SD-1_S14]|nr:hypothetical protein [Salmonella phage SD-2_S15]WPK19146.1 hypothetical protein [Salmonella phage SD-6_S16]WPK19819.1 hypothetical protein [Salmonella phage SD-1_S14]WPK20842.1 hypothetical protein [Salmonella phage SD-15_S21]